MNLHLFSTPGEPLLRDITAAAATHLQAQAEPLVVYIPSQSVPEYTELARQAFAPLARLELVDLTIPGGSYADLLDRAGLVFIPGGNTFVLLNRLRESGIFSFLAERLQDGLPYVGFSAGTLICGDNILTSNDINACGCSDFSGFGLVPYNFAAHFPQEEGERRLALDERYAEYYEFHDNPILAMEDGAYIRVVSGAAELRSGRCWIIIKGRGRKLLEPGPVLPQI